MYNMNSAVIPACICLLFSPFINSLRNTDCCLNVTWLVAVAARCQHVLSCPLWVMPQDPSVILSSACFTQTSTALHHTHPHTPTHTHSRTESHINSDSSQIQNCLIVIKSNRNTVQDCSAFLLHSNHIFFLHIQILRNHN